MAGSINAGQSVAYDSLFPKPNIDQPSQQFRDNFTILQKAFENLYNAANSGVIRVDLLQSASTGGITLAANFLRNTNNEPEFIIPFGTSTNTSGKNGSIRINSITGKFEVCAQNIWGSPVIENNGVVNIATLSVSTRLTVPINPTQNNDAVPLAVLNSRISTEANARVAGDQALANAVNHLTSDVNNTVVVLVQRDNDLANSISQVNANVASVVLLAQDANTVAYQAFATATAEVNDRVNADTALQSQITDLQTAVGIANATANYANAAILVEEQGRKDADNAISTRQDIAETRIDSLELNLGLEAQNRADGDIALANSIAQLNIDLTAVDVAETAARQAGDNALDARIDYLEATTSHIYTGSTDPVLAQANAGTWNGSTAYTMDEIVFRNERAYMANANSTGVDPETDSAGVYWRDYTEANDGDLWIMGPHNYAKFYNITSAEGVFPVVANWEDVTAPELINYLHKGDGGTITGAMVFTNSVTMTGALSANTITGTSASFTGGLSANTVTGTSATFTGLTANTITGTTASFTGALAANTVTANNVSAPAGSITSLTGTTATFTGMVSGTTGGFTTLNATQINANSGSFTGTLLANTVAIAKTLTVSNTVSVLNADLTVSNATAVVMRMRASDRSLYVANSITAGGDIIAFGDVSALSDQSVKTNVQTLEGSLNKVLALRGVSYNRTDLPDNAHQIGFIAQEVAPVVPQLIKTLPTGMMVLNYANMNALLVEAIKELKAEIEELKKR